MLFDLIRHTPILKKFVLAALPGGLLQAIRKIYYLRMLKTITENEEVEFKVIKYLIRKGDRVIDVGANIGVYTKFLSELVGSAGIVHSIEPLPLTFDILCSNIKKLRLHNVEPINCAVSDNNADIVMEIPRNGLAGENFYRARVVSGDANGTFRQVKVTSRTLDSMFSDLPHNISFIKCDVEGHEFQCLKGASTIIKTRQPIWLIEVTGDPASPHSRAYRIFDLLKAERYEPYWLENEHLRKWQPGDQSTNYFFLAPGHLDILKQREDIGLFMTAEISGQE